MQRVGADQSLIYREIKVSAKAVVQAPLIVRAWPARLAVWLDVRQRQLGLVNKEPSAASLGDSTPIRRHVDGDSTSKGRRETLFDLCLQS